VAKDGNCAYASVLRCLHAADLTAIHSKPTSVKELRRLFVQGYIARRDELSVFDNLTDDDVKQHLEEFYWNDTCGDYVMAVLARVLECNIVIYSTSNTPPQLMSAYSEHERCRLAPTIYVHYSRVHYDPLLPYTLSSPSSSSSSSSSSSFASTGEDKPKALTAAELLEQNIDISLLLVDARKCAPSRFAQIRAVREQGVAELSASILQHGLSSQNLITIQANADAPKVNLDQAEEKKEKELLELVSDVFAKTYQRGNWEVVDGMHRVRAIQQLFERGALKHPFVCAQLLKPDTSAHVCIMLAYSENMKLIHIVPMTLADHLSLVDTGRECMKKQRMPGGDIVNKVAEFIEPPSKQKKAVINSNTRRYVSLALNLCEEARELIRADSTSANPMYTVNVLTKHMNIASISTASKRDPEAKKKMHERIQVAILNHIRRWYSRKDAEEEETRKEHETKKRTKQKKNNQSQDLEETKQKKRIEFGKNEAQRAVAIYKHVSLQVAEANTRLEQLKHKFHIHQVDRRHVAILSQAYDSLWNDEQHHQAVETANNNKTLVTLLEKALYQLDSTFRSQYYAPYDVYKQYSKDQQLALMESRPPPPAPFRMFLTDDEVKAWLEKERKDKQKEREEEARKQAEIKQALRLKKAAEKLVAAARKNRKRKRKAKKKKGKRQRMQPTTEEQTIAAANEQKAEEDQQQEEEEEEEEEQEEEEQTDEVQLYQTLWSQMTSLLTPEFPHELWFSQWFRQRVLAKQETDEEEGTEDEGYISGGGGYSNLEFESSGAPTSPSLLPPASASQSLPASVESTSQLPPASALTPQSHPSTTGNNEEDELRSQCDERYRLIHQDVERWLENAKVVDEFGGKADLVILDPPWGVLKISKGNKPDVTNIPEEDRISEPL